MTHPGDAALRRIARLLQTITLALVLGGLLLLPLGLAYTRDRT